MCDVCAIFWIIQDIMGNRASQPKKEIEPTQEVLDAEYCDFINIYEEFSDIITKERPTLASDVCPLISSDFYVYVEYTKFSEQNTDIIIKYYDRIKKTFTRRQSLKCLCTNYNSHLREYKKFTINVDEFAKQKAEYDEVYNDVTSTLVTKMNRLKTLKMNLNTHIKRQKYLARYRIVLLDNFNSWQKTLEFDSDEGADIIEYLTSINIYLPEKFGEFSHK